jgi:hypothetical protein
MAEQSKPYYWRNLPHWQPPGANIFLTWQLEGSLPRAARERLAATRALLEREAARTDEDTDQRKRVTTRNCLLRSIRYSIRLKAVHSG